MNISSNEYYSIKLVKVIDFIYSFITIETSFKITMIVYSFIFNHTLLISAHNIASSFHLWNESFIEIWNFLFIFKYLKFLIIWIIVVGRHLTLFIFWRRLLLYENGKGTSMNIYFFLFAASGHWHYWFLFKYLLYFLYFFYVFNLFYFFNFFFVF